MSRNDVKEVVRWLAVHALTGALVLGAASLLLTRGLDLNRYDHWRTTLRLKHLSNKLDAGLDAVLLGNSMLGWGVDDKAFGRAMREAGYRASTVTQDASGPAFWYLAIKNVICRGNHAPRALFLFSIGNQLTRTSANTAGKYAQSLYLAGDGPETELYETLMRNYLVEASYTDLALCFLRRHWRALNYKNGLRSWFFSRTADWPEAALPRLADAVGGRNYDELIQSVVPPREPVRNAPVRISEYERTGSLSPYDFEAALGYSLLPRIIALCREHDVRLVIVNMKARAFCAPADDPARRGLEAYTPRLLAYLRDAGVEVIDFSGDTFLQDRHYVRGEHLSREARGYFSPLVTGRIRACLDAMIGPSSTPAAADAPP